MISDISMKSFLSHFRVTKRHRCARPHCSAFGNVNNKCLCVVDCVLYLQLLLYELASIKIRQSRIAAFSLNGIYWTLFEQHQMYYENYCQFFNWYKGNREQYNRNWIWKLLALAWETSVTLPLGNIWDMRFPVKEETNNSSFQFCFRSFPHEKQIAIAMEKRK